MKEDLQIPTVLIRGSAAHYRPLWSFYQSGIIVPHLVEPVVPTQPHSPKMSKDGTE